jgi:hypothetical protein
MTIDFREEQFSSALLAIGETRLFGLMRTELTMLRQMPASRHVDVDLEGEI